MQQSYFYILASRSRVLYVAVTSDLERRVNEHKHKAKAGFTSRYRVIRLVYCEVFADIRDAIQREKQVKGWRRAKKLALIETINPEWKKLSEVWAL